MSSELPSTTSKRIVFGIMTFFIFSTTYPAPFPFAFSASHMITSIYFFCSKPAMWTAYNIILAQILPNTNIWSTFSIVIDLAALKTSICITWLTDCPFWPTTAIRSSSMDGLIAVLIGAPFLISIQINFYVFFESFKLFICWLVWVFVYHFVRKDEIALQAVDFYWTIINLDLNMLFDTILTEVVITFKLL